MIINCSGGKGLQDVEMCLICAHDGENTCGYDFTLLRAMFAQDQGGMRYDKVHVTDLTGCLRKAWYDKKQPSPQYPHEMLARFLGTSTHASLEMGKNDILESELQLITDGLEGKADVVYKNGRLLDFKTTRWLYPAKVPYGSHALQVNIYAWMLRKMGREVTSLQIQYVDMSGPTKCRKCKVPVRVIDGEYRCPKCNELKPNAHLGALLVEIPIMGNEEIEQFITERKEALQAAMEMGLPPEKEPGYLCAYCPHAEVCAPEISLE